MLNIIVDQRASSGIGVYALELFNLLEPRIDSISLISASYMEGPALQPPWVHPSFLPVSGSPALALLALVRGQRRLARWDVVRNATNWLCGAHYSLVGAGRYSIATVHDFHIRSFREISALPVPGIAREISTLMTYVENHVAIPEVDLIIVPSLKTQEEVATELGVKSYVIPHWINRSRFHPRDQAHCREILGLPRNAKLILNVGAGTANKNEDCLTELLERLPMEYHLLKVGHMPKRASERVIGISYLSDEMYPLAFNAANVYVHTSTAEGFGRPLIEAMGCGTPVVSFETPTAVEILGPNYPFLVKPGDVLGLVNCVRRLESPERVSDATASLSTRAGCFSEELARDRYIGLLSTVPEVAALMRKERKPIHAGD
ncbi:MAG: glycosyltransferase [Euryarchaeota archaeon]|nr:glycosyltransferase [Euryarchaeota archaeon]